MVCTYIAERLMQSVLCKVAKSMRDECNPMRINLLYLVSLGGGGGGVRIARHKNHIGRCMVTYAILL